MMFADFILEFGAQQAALPHRGLAWTIAAESPEWRLLLSAPQRDPGVLTEIHVDGWDGWVIGEIYGYRGIPQDTTACVASFLKEVCEGQAAPESLAGRFLVLAWARSTKTWNLWTDRTASQHAYVAGEGKQTAIGTFSGAIYPYSRRQLDWVALTGFFTLGFFPGDRTFYQDVRVLRPSSRYIFSKDGQQLRHEEYWTWRHTVNARRSEDDTIAEFGETLTRAIDLQTRSGRIALPLSGGLDSRTLAACLPADRRVVSYSYGYQKDSVEPSIARGVAEAVNLPFCAHTIRPYLFTKLDLVLDAVEGFQDVTQSRQADMSEWLTEHADFVLAGHWGDVLCDTMGIEPEAPGEQQVNHLAKKMTKRGSEWLASHLCAAQLGNEKPAGIVRDLLHQEWKRFDGIEDADFRVKAVKTTQWAYRWTLASVRMYQAGAVPRLPFLDPGVLDFFCTVPTEYLEGRRIQVEYLKRFAPAVARVRWQSFDADLFHYQHFNSWQLPKRAWGRLQRTFTKPALKRNWEVQFQGPAQMGKLAAHLHRPGSLLSELLPTSAVSGLLDEFQRKPGAANGYAVSMLLTFSAWADRFHN